jgi:hypothetical protein
MILIFLFYIFFIYLFFVFLGGGVASVTMTSSWRCRQSQHVPASTGHPQVKLYSHFFKAMTSVETHTCSDVNRRV